MDEHFFAEIDKQPTAYVKKSSDEYFLKENEKSYPVRRDLRGQAIVFVSTEERIGWQEDVKGLHRLFKGLNVLIEKDDYIVDPTKEVLHQKMLEFCCKENHATSDYAFIVFMGHAYGIHSVHMRVAGQEDVKLYETCQACCIHPESKLRDKPKTILLQACRGYSQGGTYGDDEAVDLKMVKQEPFKHYVIAYACLPGNQAMRNISSGSNFIQEFVEVTAASAYENTLHDLCADINKHFEEQQKQQMVSTKSAINARFNYFPGLKNRNITVLRTGAALARQTTFNIDAWGAKVDLSQQTLEKLKSESICSLKDLQSLNESDLGELNLTIGQRNAIRHGLRKIGVAIRSDHTSKAAMPEGHEEFDIHVWGESHGIQQKTIYLLAGKGIIDKKTLISTSEETLKCTVQSVPETNILLSAKNTLTPYESNTKKHHYGTRQARTSESRGELDTCAIKLTVTKTEPIGREYQAQNGLINTDNTQMERGLSKALGSTTIENKTTGSVVLYLRVKNAESIDYICYLEKAGLLSDILQYCLVTMELLDRCQLSAISLNAELIKDEDISLPTTYHHSDIYVQTGKDAVINCSQEGISHSWYKDYSPLNKSKDKRIICKSNKSELHIKQVTVEDTGVYECRTDTKDGHRFNNIFYLHVTGIQKTPQNENQQPCSRYSLRKISRQSAKSLCPAGFNGRSSLPTTSENRKRETERKSDKSLKKSKLSQQTIGPPAKKVPNHKQYLLSLQQ